MTIPKGYTDYTASPILMEGDPAVTNKVRIEKTYFLFGFIPIWHTSEEHIVRDVYAHIRATELPVEMN